MFAHVDAYPGDPILTLNESFGSDPRSDKVNLSIGICFDEQGRLPVMSAIRQAESQLLADIGPKPYLPMAGAPNYRQAVQGLLFGSEHEVVRQGRVVTLQSLGGSGALKVGADFLRRYFPQSDVWVSDPTWDNHRAMFEGAGFAVHTYAYYDAASGGVDIEAMLESLRRLPRHAIVLLHACCHNPTGADPTRQEWREVIEVLRQRELLAFVDMAYQGFAQGLDEDAWLLRALADEGLSFLVANSFSKSASLYGERVGALSVVCPNDQQAQHVLGQLMAAVRRNYSSPPTHGGQIIARMLQSPTLRQQWTQELQAMRLRIVHMRQRLHDAVVAAGAKRDASRLLSQCGLFSYSGLSAEQVDTLREVHAVYLVRSGRMCVAGLNDGNVDRVAAALAAVW